MKGIVFNLLEAVVSNEYGENTWDALLESAELEGAYTSLGDYTDAELLKLVEAASIATSQAADDVVRWFGRSALPLLAEKYPQFFEPHEDLRSFLLTLNDVIHPEVRKLYPGAGVPVFDFDAESDSVLLIGYRSTRGLCAFGEGLILGAAAHFSNEVTVVQPQCALRGDEKCVFHVTLSG